MVPEGPSCLAFGDSILRPPGRGSAGDDLLPWPGAHLPCPALPGRTHLLCSREATVFKPGAERGYP